MTLTDLTLINGVGPNTGKNLAAAGFTTVAEIAGCWC
ncbi:MAG: helix-hairpin-helix domain-containing protein [Deferrisomatales bacterium]|nr:helix-hairpin-helix domain-containing protein [Deferrisomatales bacterium]